MADTMTDRDLVVALAERVMNWRIDVRGDMKQRVYATDPEDDYRMLLWDEQSEVPTLIRRWNPLENLLDAWMLVEALQAEGFWFRIQSSWDKQDRKYYAGFEEDGFTGWNGRPTYQGISDSAPRAISLAAACAVGIKDDAALARLTEGE